MCTFHANKPNNFRFWVKLMELNKEEIKIKGSVIKDFSSFVCIELNNLLRYTLWNSLFHPYYYFYLHPVTPWKFKLVRILWTLLLVLPAPIVEVRIPKKTSNQHPNFTICLLHITGCWLMFQIYIKLEFKILMMGSHFLIPVRSFIM